MNIQNIPRSDKVVKSAFVPKLDAYLFADYPNIELKLLAYYLESVGHPSMADVFRQGADLHRQTAAGLTGKSPGDISDSERQVGKVLNFSIVYGGGAPTLIQQLGVTFPEAMELLHTYHSTWPGIGWDRKRYPADPGTLVDLIKGRVAERGYIQTLYGRALHPRSMHSALNALCQGCAADLLKWGMVRTHAGLTESNYQSHLVNTVHDELMLDCAADELAALAVALPEWMTDPRIEAVVPIRPECEVSYTTWADKEPYIGRD